ncbi:aspartokinase 2, chloroplastic-like isoform X3 [Malania oleifera]|uniref:aspartokinase 2, chloroplastic-like isoform X3 n=1 Tax=Malania oleifera TaxID=397392 RepID=UPI0025AEB238|nr:aspartokinase 2, chloroplastic-like isoform X3 [Malania oleifera]
MANTLHFCGVRTPYPVFSKMSLCHQPLWAQQQQQPDFAVSVGSSFKLCRSLKGSCRGRVLRVCCDGKYIDVIERNKTDSRSHEQLEEQLTCVMKFGGSSVASAERMREVADLILSFPEERPVIVLSAMGKTTNKLLLAGEKAVSCGVSNACSIDELSFIKDLHLRTVNELGVDRSIISTHLEELEQLLKGISMMKELTLRTRDYLVSFGECMSTRIFAAYLNKIGVNARQYDAFDIGFITTDDFTNADILEATYPAVAKRLNSDWTSDRAIPVVTGFLGKGWRSCAVTTLGRGGSDLTATTIGKALGLQEIQVWKDVDGVLTCDPNIYPRAEPVPFLTFDEAAELAYFGAQVFSIFEDLGISVDVVATSEVSISLTLDPSKLWSRELIQQELDHVVEELEKIAVVNLLQHRSIISLIGNVQKSSLILEKVFCVLRTNGTNVQMISQGASKQVNISLIVNDNEAEQCVRALHSTFFETELSELDLECDSLNGSV